MSEDSKPYSGPNTNVPAHSSPYPVSRLAAPISLTDTAREIESASVRVSERTNAQLRVIAEQIEQLQARAAELLDAARQDLALHHAECRFRKVVGQVYHLYRRADDTVFFSMLSPGEQGGAPRHDFIASYQLQSDQSWIRVGQVTPQSNTPLLLRKD